MVFTDDELAVAYQNYKGPVAVAKMAKPRPNEKTFRNNKYSVFNQGRLASNFGRGGTFIFTDKKA